MVNLNVSFDDKYYDGLKEIINYVISDVNFSKIKTIEELEVYINNLPLKDENLKEEASIIIIPLFLEGSNELNEKFQAGMEEEVNEFYYDEWVDDNINLALAFPLIYSEIVLKEFTKQRDSYYGKNEEIKDINLFIENLEKSVEKKVNSKLEFYAVDQTGELVNGTSKEMFVGNGMNSYIWQSMGDDRVRELHEENHGNVFYFEIGDPEGNNPGQAPRCRCGYAIQSLSSEKPKAA